jgi:hypothetical protein
LIRRRWLYLWIRTIRFSSRDPSISVSPLEPWRSLRTFSCGARAQSQRFARLYHSKDASARTRNGCASLEMPMIANNENRCPKESMRDTWFVSFSPFSDSPFLVPGVGETLRLLILNVPDAKKSLKVSCGRRITANC